MTPSPEGAKPKKEEILPQVSGFPGCSLGPQHFGVHVQD